MQPGRSDTPANRAGLWIVLAIVIGGLMLLLSWIFRFPWDYLGY